MTVKQLIETLEGFEPDDEVHFVYNYGDYIRTNVAQKVRYVEDGMIKDSAYHRLPRVVDDDDDDEAPDVRPAVLIW